MSVHPIERRSECRLAGSFGSVIFRRTPAGRQAARVLAEEISGRAVRLRLPNFAMLPGDYVFALVHMAGLTGGVGPRVAIRGRVLRVDARSDGTVAAVVTLTRHRWLFADAGGGGSVDGLTARYPERIQAGEQVK